MKSVKLVFVSLVVLTNLGSNSYGAVRVRIKDDSTAVKKAISQVYNDRETAFLLGDSALFLKCYTEDAAMMPPGIPIISGMKGLSAFFKIAHTRGLRDIVISPIALYSLTDQFVTEQGQYEMFDGYKNSIGKGKYLVLWKKTHDGWKIFRDMFNDDSKSTIGRE